MGDRATVANSNDSVGYVSINKVNPNLFANTRPNVGTKLT